MINNNENNEDNLDFNNQEKLKQNLMNFENYNLHNINNNIDNNKNELKDNIQINEIPKTNNLKVVIKNDQDNNLKNDINSINIIKKPYYFVYYEKINDDEDDIKDEEFDDEQLNDIDKLNMELYKGNKKDKNIKIDINDYVWHCLYFNQEKPENIFNTFFNDDEI